MKLKHLFTICLATAAIAASAQGYKDGIEYYRAGQLRNAKSILERNLNKPETDKAEANYYLGSIAVEQRKLADAKKYFDAGIAANPSFGLNYAGLGAIDLLNKDVKAAEAQFKLAEKYSKSDAAAIKIAIARAYYEADPVAYEEKINKLVEQARKKNMKEPDIYLFEGDMEAAKQNYGEAGGKYEMAIGYQPDTAEGYVKYAKLFDEVNPDYSIRKLEELLSIMPNSALGQRELAMAYYNQKQYDKAAEQYGRYVKNPNHFKEDEDQYALLLFSDSKYKEGYDYATALLKANPNNFTAQRFQFMNAAQLPEMQDQMLAMADALYAKHNASADNKFAPIDYNLIASYYSNAKRYDDAIKVLYEAMKDFPSSAQFPKALAMVYVNTEKYANAANAFAKYVDMLENPKYSDLVQASRFAYYAGMDKLNNKEADADKYLEMSENVANRVIEIYPSQYMGYKQLGDLKMLQAEESQLANVAVEDYKTAAEKMAALGQSDAATLRDAKTVMGYLINYYAKAGDKDNVSKYAEMYLQLDPADAAGFGKFK